MRGFWDDDDDYSTVGLSVIDPRHARAALMRWMKDRGFGQDEFDREGFAEEIWENYLEPVLFLDAEARVGDGHRVEASSAPLDELTAEAQKLGMY